MFWSCNYQKFCYTATATATATATTTTVTTITYSYDCYYNRHTHCQFVFLHNLISASAELHRIRPGL